MDVLNLLDELKGNSYPGRGIVIGRSECGTKAVIAYFLTGRSEGSRNRIILENGSTVSTKSFDESKLQDPSLFVYNAVRVLGNKTIVTNGEQTDTIYELMDKQASFEQSLRTWDFEPDSLYTPRISGIVHIKESGDMMFNYALSVIKSADGNPDGVHRFNFAYNNPCKGKGHFIHTYKGEIGGEVPSFEGEPKPVEIKGDIDTFTNAVWENLNEENKVSLYTRFIDIESGEYESRIVNKNK